MWGESSIGPRNIDWWVHFKIQGHLAGKLAHIANIVWCERQRLCRRARGWVWRGGGRGEEIVSSKVTAGRSRAVRLPPRRRGACDFHGRLRAAVWRGGERGGGSERARERDSSGGFYCFKIQLQPEGCSAESCGPTTPPFPLPPPPPPPSFLPSAPREGAGGVPGPQAGAARRRRGRGGRGGSSRELKGLLGGGGGGEAGRGVREAGGGGEAGGGEPGPYSVKDLSRHARNL